MNQRFQDMLLRYAQTTDPDGREAIERSLWADFGCERAVLVVDMSGFSSLSLRHGIVHYLSMVRRMQLIAQPVVSRRDGIILKFEADNAFAMFLDVEAALEAAFELNAAFDAANRATPDELDIRIACGIDYGPILVIEEQDFFGDAVNRASKLGEDLAAPGEILLAAPAAARLADPTRWQLRPQTFQISGIRLDAMQARPPQRVAGRSQHGTG